MELKNIVNISELAQKDNCMFSYLQAKPVSHRSIHIAINIGKGHETCKGPV